MPSILPLRTVVLQALFLIIAIAIEAVVLHRQLKLSPREGVQYSATINLLSTVVGWVVVFALLNTDLGGQLNTSLSIEVALLNFVLFNQFTPGIGGGIVILAFIIFFASFVLKQLGLLLLKWLLDPALVQATPPPNPEVRSVMRDPRELVGEEVSSEILTVLIANALSYTAIAVVLFLLYLINNPAVQ